MLVGVCTIRLWMPANDSLKAKRRILRSLMDRVKAHYNVSIAEVDAQDDWQRAVLGIACITSEPHLTRQILEAIVRQIEGQGLAEVTDVEVELR